MRDNLCSLTSRRGSLSTPTRSKRLQPMKKQYIRKMKDTRSYWRAPGSSFVSSRRASLRHEVKTPYLPNSTQTAGAQPTWRTVYVDTHAPNWPPGARGWSHLNPSYFGTVAPPLIVCHWMLSGGGGPNEVFHWRVKETNTEVVLLTGFFPIWPNYQTRGIICDALYILICNIHNTLQ